MLPNFIQTFKPMNPTVSPLLETLTQTNAEIPDLVKVQVRLLDRDDLPLASGTATLPVLLGVGVFWPSCPMPAASQLATAKCFALPTGEMMKLQSLKLFAEDPPRYEFRVSRSLEDEGILVSE